MSVCSSAASNCSVSFQGKEMSLEEALDETCRGVQSRLNELQVVLRNMASIENQDLDELDDFKECVELEEQTTDLIEELTNLLSELPGIAGEIRGKCPKELKDWYKQHKDERKRIKAQEKQRLKSLSSIIE